MVLVLYRFLVVVVVTLAIVGGVAAASSLGANGIWFVSPLAPPPLPSSNVYSNVYITCIRSKSMMPGTGS